MLITTRKQQCFTNTEKRTLRINNANMLVCVRIHTQPISDNELIITGKILFNIHTYVIHECSCEQYIYSSYMSESIDKTAYVDVVADGSKVCRIIVHSYTLE